MTRPHHPKHDSKITAPPIQPSTPGPGLRPERVAPSGQLNDPPRREMAAQHLPLLAHVRVLTPYGPDLGRGICAPALGAGGLTIPRTPICVSPGALWSGRDEVSAPFSHGCDVAGRVCDGPLPSASPLHMRVDTLHSVRVRQRIDNLLSIGIPQVSRKAKPANDRVRTRPVNMSLPKGNLRRFRSA